MTINYIATDSDLTAVANAIRTKGGTSSSLAFPSGMVSAIQNLPSAPVLQSKTATANGTVTADSGYDGLSSVVVNVQSPKDDNYLCFTALENSSVRIAYIERTFTAPSIEYSLDLRTWNSYTIGNIITLNAGSKCYWKGNSQTFSISNSQYLSFALGSGKVMCSGNIMSLIANGMQSNEIPNEFCFAHLFENYCTSMITPPLLPATKLKNSCYAQMFSGCTSLQYAPELPATELLYYCYYSMFSGCTSITQAPSMSLSSLGPHCCRLMFKGCTSLAKPPQLLGSGLKTYCYYGIFMNCTSLRIADITFGGTGTRFFEFESVATIPDSAVTSMFSGTGGTYTSDPAMEGIYGWY